MPRNPRQNIKRDLDACLGHIAKICGILDYTAGIYKDAAPEYLDRYKVAFNMTIELGELIQAIRNET